MKHLLGSLLVAMAVFPTTLSQHAVEVNARADKALLEIAPKAVQASEKGRHYVYYSVKPWDSSVAKEIRYRLNKLDGIWTDPDSSGPIFVHFK